MIKDVKSYFQTVASRISNAFRMESFETEDELEFWALSAEYLSQSAAPSFVDITGWIDRLYRAPVHFIYKAAKDEKLILFKRHIIPENIIPDVDDGSAEINPTQKSKAISGLEEELQNLEHKISFSEDFMSIGLSGFSIGQCEHIPLFRGGEFWGIYCLGPYVQSPEAMIPKFSIISRILTRWLTALEEEGKGNKIEQNPVIVEQIEGFGSGKLEISEVSRLLIRHIAEVTGASYGAVVSKPGGSLDFIARYLDAEQAEEPFPDLPASDLFAPNTSPISFTETAMERINRAGYEDSRLVPITDRGVIILLYKDKSVMDLKTVDSNLQQIIDTQEALLVYQSQSEQLSDQLVETYYRMLRILEMKREKTAWHTPRMIAFADKFSDLFGLDEIEKANLLLTAKLHDIGYVGSLHINKKMSVGSELEHPLIGEMMIKQLTIPQDVKDGIRTHHEWINGSGSPRQLKEEEIAWTGKIIGVFEFIVEFIENKQHRHTETDNEYMEELMEELLARADEQFDMVLVPTFIELLRSLGWEQCSKLGTE